MEFGLFSQHYRPARSVADAYEEDLFELVAADQLGYREAWISEHAFPAELIIGTLLLLAGRDLAARDCRLRSLRLFMEQVAPAVRDLRPPPATPLAGAGVAGDGLQAEGGGQLFGTEPDAARKRRPGPAVEREPEP
jgi:hypothetical protein